jgi:hypothetical protein
MVLPVGERAGGSRIQERLWSQASANAEPRLCKLGKRKRKYSGGTIAQIPANAHAWVAA